MVKLVFYIPKNEEKPVLDAIFAAGAGQIGNYINCCFKTEGFGQFMAKVGANPKIGKINELETVVEYRIETICPKSKLDDVLVALRKTHPYEEPAIDVFELYNKI
ncbi:hypothetical protein [Bacteriovorax sp. Seq25_V]|uniref:hypothetical protein n=1 Tax=Bacteriovorax sp. Seq25_V TaxID=1201288 RepID=UPI00038A1A4E|nr:hypothetical protein [Bacteriovorax sp. Seq25_V]EQC44264.1 hypothetical protein M900_A0338 [Bacteriovorax sp. Seq25_V]